MAAGKGDMEIWKISGFSLISCKWHHKHYIYDIDYLFFSLTHLSVVQSSSDRVKASFFLPREGKVK